MPGSIWPVTMRPGHAPEDLQFFSFLWFIPHPQARRKRQFPTPRAPDRPQIRFMGTSFLKQCWFPYNSKKKKKLKQKFLFVNASTIFSFKKLCSSLKLSVTCIGCLQNKYYHFFNATKWDRNVPKLWKTLSAVFFFNFPPAWTDGFFDTPCRVHCPKTNLSKSWK